MNNINRETLKKLWFKILDAFIDERYQEKRIYMIHCRDDPQDLEHRKYWSAELASLEKWRLFRNFSPIILSLMAVIISLIALLNTIG